MSAKNPNKQPTAQHDEAARTSLTTFYGQQMQAMIQYAVELCQRACSQPSQPGLLAEAFEELRVTIEELQVTEEELRAQNEELIATRQEVEAERQRYQDLFEFAPDGYLVTNLEGIIQEANRAAAGLLHRSQKHLVGKPLISFIPVAERRVFRTQLIQLTSQAGSAQEWQVRLQRRQEPPESQLEAARELPVLDAALTVAVVRDADNQPIALRWLLRDITERKQAEEQIRTLNAELEQRVMERTAELEQANRVKDDFLATVSHELRSPLNSILGWARLLQNRKFDQATTVRALETIERNAKAQTHLIEDLLDVSRIIRGKLRLSVRPVQLAPIIEAAVDAMRPAAETKTINFGFSILERAQVACQRAT